MNHTFISHPVSGYLLDDELYSLANREWDVLLLLTEDICNQEIADWLHLAINSVKVYRRRIGEKLSIQGRDHLSRFARKNKKWIKNKYF